MTEPLISPHGPKPKARAATSNATGRFEPYRRSHVDDGWDREEEPVAFRTEVAVEKQSGILSRNTSPDIPFDVSVNPYRGCEHGCIYCFARPTHAFLGLSPGLDFETRIVAKPAAPDLLRKALRGRRYSPQPIAIGTNTDPYQPVEARMAIMRGVLGVLRDHNHPVTILTKGSLIERDIDILAPMAEHGLAHAGISLTTLDRDLSRAMEPRAPSPERRLQSIRRLRDAGIPVRVMFAPIIPGLTDHEIEPLVAAAREAGASACDYITLRLPLEVAELFSEWLKDRYPARAAKVLGRVRELHNGKDYNADWGSRMRGSGIHARLIAQRFSLARKRCGFSPDLPRLRNDLFEVPGQLPRQPDLFG